MKIFRALVLTCVSLSLVLLISCATTGKSPNEDASLIIRGDEQNPNKLIKNQELSITHKVENPVFLNVTNWSKVRILSDLLDSFKGHKDFTNEQKYSVLSYIFDDLPLNGTDGVIREVYIGKYFTNGNPLIIRVGVFTPKGEAAKQNEKAIVLMTNIVTLADGAINKTMGAFINLDMNASVFCVLNNNLLTNGQKLEKDNNIKIESIESMSGIEQVMVAQAYLGDENIGNDNIANELVTNILLDNKEIPAIVIMSMLMKYEYLLSIENIEEAGILWNKIIEYSVNVPGDMNPQNLEQINGASIFLMKKLTSI